MTLMRYFPARSTWVHGWCTRASNLALSECRDVYIENWCDKNSVFKLKSAKLLWWLCSGWCKHGDIFLENLNYPNSVLHPAYFLSSTCLKWGIRPDILSDQNIRPWLFSSSSSLLFFCASGYLFPAHRCEGKCVTGKCSAGACGELKRFQYSPSQKVGIL